MTYHRPHTGLLLFVMAVVLFTACAKMGRPDGGWFDETPPHVIGSTPADKSCGVKSRKVEILFDEFIKIDNPSEKVVVSPPQLEQPEIKGQGKRIVVELQDTLKDNITYTIDFSDAISDNNEGNPLGNYTYTFSTGDHIDTLEVAGHVLKADNLEPVKGILVGLYDDLADSAFKTKPMLRVSRTDEDGRFVIKGVAEGSYRIYALQDADGNYMLSQKSEMLAFNNNTYQPTFKPDMRQDTIWRDSLHIASIERTPYTHFLPDNITLLAFTEELSDRYLLKAERSEAEYFTLYFSHGDTSLPEIHGLDFDEKDAFITETSPRQDTIYYWLRDTALVNRDTLRFELSYLATDTTGILTPQTDTLELFSRKPYARRLKDKQEKYDKWKKKQERLMKKGKPYQEEMPPEPLNVEYGVPSSIDPDQNLTFAFLYPLERIDTAAIHLYERIDTMWYRKPFLFGEMAGKNRKYTMVAEWVAGNEYSLEIDSMAFTDIYGRMSSPKKTGLKVRRTEEYCNLVLTLQGMADTSVVVQLLSSGDKVIKEVFTTNGEATIYYVKPGEYYLRMFVDSNGNGIWDTGCYDEGRQAEAVYYYPEKLECRENWELRESWNPTSKDISRQKPSGMGNKKGNNKKTMSFRNAERARKLGVAPPERR